MFKKILILLAALALSFIGSFLINVNFVTQSEAYSVWPVLLIFALIIKIRVIPLALAMGI